MNVYPRDVADELHKMISKSRFTRFAKLQGDANSIEELKKYTLLVEPIPSLEHTRELLDIAFFSSLTQEEGQSVTFSVLYCDPAFAAESKWPCVRLDNAIPLTTEHVRKLSPAAPRDTVDIGVFPYQGTLRIWGLVYVRSQRSHPLGLSVTAIQTGAFSAKFSNKEILSYSRGSASFFDPDESIEAIGLQQLIAKAFADGRPFLERYKAAASLLNMSSVPLELGYGATLLVVPQHHEVKGLDAPRYKADTNSCETLWSALTSHDQADVMYRAARLLFIDGAVVFQEGVGLLGAGAMIQTNDNGDFSVRVVSPYRYSDVPIETTLSKFNGGARHRSALVFCYSNPGALAIVVSQDGVLSLLVRPLSENFVFAIRPIRRGTQLI